MNFNVVKYLKVLKKNMVVCIGITVVCLGMVFFNLFSKNHNVYTSTSLLSYDYSELVNQKSETNITDLMYRKVADYVAIAKTDSFKQLIGLSDKENISVNTTLLRDSHVIELSIKANSKEEALSFEKTAQQELQKIAEDMYKDKFIVISHGNVKETELSKNQIIKTSAIGILAGGVISLAYVMIQYTRTKD